jgi:hypothetical protein
VEVVGRDTCLNAQAGNFEVGCARVSEEGAGGVTYRVWVTLLVGDVAVLQDAPAAGALRGTGEVAYCVGLLAVGAVASSFHRDTIAMITTSTVKAMLRPIEKQNATHNSLYRRCSWAIRQASGG